MWDSGESPDPFQEDHKPWLVMCVSRAVLCVSGPQAVVSLVCLMSSNQQASGQYREGICNKHQQEGRCTKAVHGCQLWHQQQRKRSQCLIYGERMVHSILNMLNDLDVSLFVSS